MRRGFGRRLRLRIGDCLTKFRGSWEGSGEEGETGGGVTGLFSNKCLYYVAILITVRDKDMNDGLENYKYA
jgi:hypothetical protein